LEYTGAPYFSGATVVRLCGHLSHIFCARSAAIPIKSYAPEQIVHPCLPDPGDGESSVDSALATISKWSSVMSAFVIGPGRDPLSLAAAERFIDARKGSGQPLVIDGDALFFVAQKLSIVCGCKRFILTPSGIEFIRIRKALQLPEEASCLDVARALDGVTVFAKGREDVVSDGHRAQTFSFPGSPRRVGGQGDITAGALGLFAAWAPDDYFAAAGAAAELVKKAACAAFKEKGRSTITSDIIAAISRILPESWSTVAE